MKLDEKNCIILNMLQEDCRMSLTAISKKVGLSVDSVKKRMDKMKKNNIFYSKIQLRPRYFGFDNVVEVKIKVHNYTKKELVEFTDYLMQNPYVVEIISVSGEWDFTVVFISENSIDLGKISRGVRDKFHKIIFNWSESLTTAVYKFEKYDMLKIKGF